MDDVDEAIHTYIACRIHTCPSGRPDNRRPGNSSNTGADTASSKSRIFVPDDHLIRGGGEEVLGLHRRSVHLFLAEIVLLSLRRENYRRFLDLVEGIALV